MVGTSTDYALASGPSGVDPTWYLRTYHDVAAAGVDPVSHYLEHGWREGRDPRADFSTRGYLSANEDVARAGLNPFLHYLRHGKDEGRPLRTEDEEAIHEGRDHLDPYAAIYRSYWDQANVELDPTTFGALSRRPVNPALCDAKLIAYYLPQFYPIPENDEWWGRGFTEWRNVSKAVPVFAGHYQPRLPGELGFYDLRVVDVMRRQVELAKLYGISAFCFHFYWFGGKRLLEGPLLSYLDHSDLDLSFCLCWANENWTRRWDGLDSEILIGQSHSPDDDVAFIRHLKRYFDDPRYLKIEGKPMLTVYRPSVLPDARATGKRWRSEAAAMGLPGLYLVATNSFDFKDHRSIGFDALSEFPPHGAPQPLIRHSLRFVTPEHSGGVHAYLDFMRTETPSDDGTVLPGVMTGWDNSARIKGRAHIVHGSTPQLFRQWLDKSITRARRNPPDERLVLINAWNEWGEAAYLEPDRRFGYAYLAACGSAVADHGSMDREVAALLAGTRDRFKARRRFAAAIHLSHEDMAGDIASALSAFEEIDVYITVPTDISFENAQKTVALFPEAYVKEVRNRGRDMLPFLSMFELLKRGNHKFVCKLHTQPSALQSDGSASYQQLMAPLLSPEALKALAHADENPEIGLLAARGSLAGLDVKLLRQNSEGRLRALADSIGVEITFDESFVAGSMFWFRPEALTDFARLASEDDFEAELGQVDGTLAHALERMTVIAVEAGGYRVAEYGQDQTQISARGSSFPSDSSRPLCHAKAATRCLAATGEGAGIRLWSGHPAHTTPNFIAPSYRPPTSLSDHPRAVPPIELHSFADVELRSDHMPYAAGVPITDTRLYPTYVAHYYAEDLIRTFSFPTVDTVRVLDEPIFCITHFNMLTYGHFLLEVLPKLLVCKRLRATGRAKPRIAFPVNNLLWKSIVQTVCSPEELVPYDDSRERLRVPVAMIPSVGVSLDFHDVAIEEIVQLARGMCLQPRSQRLPGPRIFLSRERVTGSYRKLTNEAQLFDVASEFGFELVHPQDLPWEDQVCMFQQASHVIGEFTSALHGAMFALQGTKVVSLGWLRHDVQTSIAAAFGHTIGYILPRSGKIPEFDPWWTEVETFEISADDLRNCLELICED